MALSVDFRRVRRLSQRFWAGALFLAILVGAVAGAWVLFAVADEWPEAIVGGVIFGLVLGLLVGLLGMAVRFLNALESTNALIDIRPVLGPLLALGDEWAVEPPFIQAVLDEIQRRSPALVVECGSGISTVLISSQLDSLGFGRVVTFEHDAEFAAKTRSLLVARSLEDRVEFKVAPISTYDVADSRMDWYGGLDEADLSPQIDVLVVDGPPASFGPMARFPAVPLLRKSLAPDSVVFLHDGARRDEQETARLWADELSGRLSYIQSRKGGWMIRLGA